MAKSDMEEITAKALGKGGMLVKMYFDIHGKEQKDLQPILAELINNRLLKTKGVLYCYGSIEEPIKNGEEYATNAGITVLIDNIEDLIMTMFSFAPAAVEVLKPEGQYTIKHGELQGLLLTISSISLNYSEYILKNSMSKDDFEKVKGDLKAREELGRKILDKLEKK